jgi:enamine deaminase RidA (YjgF/YER057c/UK114 family)
MDTEPHDLVAPLQRRCVEPRTWRADPRFATAVEVRGASRWLVSGTLGPFDESGALLHEHDAVAQVALTVANLEQVLAAADMAPRDLVRVELATTDLRAVGPHLDLVAERFHAAGARPALSLTEVAALPPAGALVHLQVVAAA